MMSGVGDKKETDAVANAVSDAIFEIRVLDGRIVQIPMYTAKQIPVFAAYIARWNETKMPFKLPYSMDTLSRVIERVQGPLEDFLGIEAEVEKKMETLDDIMVDGKLRPEIRKLFKFRWGCNKKTRDCIEYLVKIQFGQKTYTLTVGETCGIGHIGHMYLRDSYAARTTIGQLATKYTFFGDATPSVVLPKLEQELLDKVPWWFDLLKEKR